LVDELESLALLASLLSRPSLLSIEPVAPLLSLASASSSVPAEPLSVQPPNASSEAKASDPGRRRARFTPRA